MNNEQFKYNHKLLRAAVLNAFSGLNIGEDVRAVNLDNDTRQFDILVCLDFLSDPVHSLTIELETDLSNLVAQTMFFCEDTCQESEIHDASKELVNIIAGGVEHSLGKGWALAPPKVISSEHYEAVTLFLTSQASLTFMVNNEYYLRVILWGKQ